MSAPLTSLPPSAFGGTYNLREEDETSLTPFDFLSFNSPSDILAPHPDLFESELDSTFANLDEPDLQVQLLPLDSHDPFAFLRTDTPNAQWTGPRSTITVSSESASGYDSLSSYSESFYTGPSAFAIDLEMEFQRVHMDPLGSYAPIKHSPNMGGAELSAALSHERASFGTFPPTPPQQHPSPESPGGLYRPRAHGRAYSDYVPSQPVVRSSAASDYYPQLDHGHTRHPSLIGMQQQRTVSPVRVSPGSDVSTRVTPPLPLSPRMHDGLDEDQGSDSRKKYKCSHCSRSFARAFNLKTHMSTHDPNRPKPHVCPHKACGRSFSRKHDLGRHLVSIHRDEHGMAHAGAGAIPVSSSRSERGVAVGVEKGSREWCESCGKGWVGSVRGCRCNDVK